jgi:hypothetical protein
MAELWILTACPYSENILAKSLTKSLYSPSLLLVVSLIDLTTIFSFL